MSLADNLKKQMEQQGFTSARSLAVKSGVAVGTVTGILNGTTTSPGIKVLNKLAIALNVPVEKLING